MSKRETIERYRLIIQRLRKTPATFAEISEFLESESEFQGYNFAISRRTFIRDKKEIEFLYNIEIVFDPSSKCYSIKTDSINELDARILEAFDILHAFNISERVGSFVHLEKRLSSGTENIYTILQAIRDRKELQFCYTKFINHEATRRTVSPLALKEFRNRWYLIAQEKDSSNPKIFGIDRISHPLQLQTHFELQKEFTTQEYFDTAYGIIITDEKPQEIILSFIPEQSDYIKTRPIHFSQEILIDNEKEFRIRLHLRQTLDLVMEILSYGSRVKVIQPQSLIDEIVKEQKKSIANY